MYYLTPFEDFFQYKLSMTKSVICSKWKMILIWRIVQYTYIFQLFLGNLGDLEEISPSVGRLASLRLFEEAIEVNRRVYNNHHVYPYTYLAGYYYRAKEFPKALDTWANAADVIQL